MDAYTLLLNGFDVEVTISEEVDSAYHVVLYESGNRVFEEDISVDLDGYSDDWSGLSESMEYAAQAAIDLYEAQRGTLGEGGGALEAVAMQKRAFFYSNYETAFLKLKGTPFEEKAVEIVEKIFELEEPKQTSELDRLNYEEARIVWELERLKFERIQSSPADRTIIVVKGRRRAVFYDSTEVSEYLDQFTASPLEAKAVSLVKDLLDVRAQRNNLEDAENTNYAELHQLELALEEMCLLALEQNLDTGPEYPAMTNDMVELMDNVVLETPLQPVMATVKKSFNEVEDNLEEQTRPAEGLEVDRVCDDFEIGDKVELKETFNQVLWGGTIVQWDKGTEGKIDESWDGLGPTVLVVFDDHELVKVPLGKLKKK